MAPRLKEHFQSDVRTKLQQQFGINNQHATPA